MFNRANFRVVNIVKFCFVTNFNITLSQWHHMFINNLNTLAAAGYEYTEVTYHPMKFEQATTYRDQSCLAEIRGADIVFVYCCSAVNKAVKQNYNTPYYVRQLMKPNAKLLIFWDDDKYQPMYYFSKYPKSTVDHALYLVPNYKFPVPSTQINMPQLYNYSSYLNVVPKPFELRNGKVALMVHSHPEANVDDKLKQFNVAFKVFTTRKTGWLHPDDYMAKLGHCWAALDDDATYYGWGRFAIECALMGVPCIGSTPTVKLLYPNLYTKINDYNRQRELLKYLSVKANFEAEVAAAKANLKYMGAGYILPRFIAVLNKLR